MAVATEVNEYALGSDAAVNSAVRGAAAGRMRKILNKRGSEHHGDTNGAKIPQEPDAQAARRIRSLRQLCAQ